MNLTIYPAPADPNGPFQAQIDLIKASGAAYDSQSKTWWLPVNAESLSSDVLNPLFKTAKDYGTPH